MSRALRRGLFRMCMTLVMPSMRVQVALAGAIRAQRRAEGWGAYVVPVMLPAMVACWASFRLAAVTGLWLAVAAAGGVEARAID